MERVISLKGLKFREYDIVWKVLEDLICKEVFEVIIKGVRTINEVPSVFKVTEYSIEVENQNGKVYKFHTNGLCFS